MFGPGTIQSMSGGAFADSSRPLSGRPGGKMSRAPVQVAGRSCSPLRAPIRGTPGQPAPRF